MCDMMHTKHKNVNIAQKQSNHQMPAQMTKILDYLTRYHGHTIVQNVSR